MKVLPGLPTDWRLERREHAGKLIGWVVMGDVMVEIPGKPKDEQAEGAAVATPTMLRAVKPARVLYPSFEPPECGIRPGQIEPEQPPFLMSKAIGLEVVAGHHVLAAVRVFLATYRAFRADPRSEAAAQQLNKAVDAFATHADAMLRAAGIEIEEKPMSRTDEPAAPSEPMTLSARIFERGRIGDGTVDRIELDTIAAEVEDLEQRLREAEDTAALEKLQERAGAFVEKHFGAIGRQNWPERARLTLKKAAELALAVGVPLDVIRDTVLKAASVTPAADALQEAGGVLVCAFAFAEARGMSARVLLVRELDRIEALPEGHYRQQAPPGSAEGGGS